MTRMDGLRCASRSGSMELPCARRRCLYTRKQRRIPTKIERPARVDRTDMTTMRELAMLLVERVLEDGESNPPEDRGSGLGMGSGVTVNTTMR